MLSEGEWWLSWTEAECKHRTMEVGEGQSCEIHVNLKGSGRSRLCAIRAHIKESLSHRPKLCAEIRQTIQFQNMVSHNMLGHRRCPGTAPSIATMETADVSRPALR